MSGELDLQVAAAVASLREELAALSGGRPVALVAVTKGFGPEHVAAACRAGVDACGENYAQELLAKADALAAVGDIEPNWHFIGRLQRNKVRQLAPLVDVWQSVDRAPVGAEIARRAPGATVLVQCNISGEPVKGGCAPEDTPGLVAELSGIGLNVCGLMGVAADADPARVRAEFAGLVTMADELGLPVRSIGMTGDYREAVAAGATMVRVGAALFGARG